MLASIHMYGIIAIKSSNVDHTHTSMLFPPSSQGCRSGTLANSFLALLNRLARLCRTVTGLFADRRLSNRPVVYPYQCND